MGFKKFVSCKFRLQKTVGLALTVLAGLGGIARAQVYVGDASGSFLIGKYTTAGTTVNASLIVPSKNATGLAVSGTSLFVADSVNYVISKYSTDGTLVNGSFLTSPDVTMPFGLTTSGSDLYVASFGGGKVGKFNVSTGAGNADFLTGLNGPWAIAVDGSTLYVSNFGGGKVGKYTTDGATVDASFITVSSPTGIGVSGAYLYVMTANDIRKYNKADGSLVDANFLTGLSSPTDLRPQCAVFDRRGAPGGDAHSHARS
jgi:sugar lactone lactonase YvrE